VGNFVEGGNLPCELFSPGGALFFSLCGGTFNRGKKGLYKGSSFEPTGRAPLMFFFSTGAPPQIGMGPLRE